MPHTPLLISGSPPGLNRGRQFLGLGLRSLVGSSSAHLARIDCRYVKGDSCRCWLPFRRRSRRREPLVVNQRRR